MPTVLTKAEIESRNRAKPVPVATPAPKPDSFNIAAMRELIASMTRALADQSDQSGEALVISLKQNRDALTSLTQKTTDALNDQTKRLMEMRPADAWEFTMQKDLNGRLDKIIARRVK